MICNYTIVKLSDIIKRYKDDPNFMNNILDTFQCCNNLDVEFFLKQKAVLFDKQGISKTHLVMTSYQGKMVIVGYFSLSIKSFVITEKAKISSNLRKRVAKFSRFDMQTNQRIIVAPLIGQLGKNDKYSDLISGDVLLKYACDAVREVQEIVGGRILYLECEDKECLKRFYESNGFVTFGKRYLDKDEDGLQGQYLLQYLKYNRDE